MNAVGDKEYADLQLRIICRARMFAGRAKRQVSGLNRGGQEPHGRELCRRLPGTWHSASWAQANWPAEMRVHVTGNR